MSDMQNQQDPKALIKKVLAPIAEDMAAVDAVIRSELASDVPRMKEISEYITSAGGKRMRPALLMLICRALGYEGTRAPVSRRHDRASAYGNPDARRRRG